MDKIVLTLVLVWVAYWDFKEKTIPDAANVILLCLGMIMQFPDIVTPIKGLIIGVILMLLVSLAGPIGGGDIKLMGALGVWFGGQIVDVFLLSYIVGLGFALIYYLKYRTMKQEVPFGPSIALAALMIYVGNISLIYDYIRWWL